MKKLFTVMMVLFGLLFFASCDADSVQDSYGNDGDDGVIIKDIEDKDDDGLPDLPY